MWDRFRYAVEDICSWTGNVIKYSAAGAVAGGVMGALISLPLTATALPVLAVGVGFGALVCGGARMFGEHTGRRVKYAAAGCVAGAVVISGGPIMWNLSTGTAPLVAGLFGAAAGLIALNQRNTKEHNRFLDDPRFRKYHREAEAGERRLYRAARLPNGCRI